MIALALLAALTGAPDGLRLEGGVFGALPASLETGQVLGPSLTALWTRDILSLGLRARLGTVDEDATNHEVHHTELRFAALAGLRQRIGRGELGLDLSAGAVIVREDRLIHLAARYPNPERTEGWRTGPQIALDASVRLFVIEGWGLAIEGGPSLAFMPDVALRVGWSGGISVVYAPGDG